MGSFNFYQADAIEELKNHTLPDYTPTTANDRYLAKNIGTWSSISDVDTFLSRFTHSSDYKDGDTELALGNYVTIQDGTYNAIWVIAGFDMEYNQTSADGNKYDNGFGICMIPQTQLTTAKWNAKNTISGAYMSSTMHTTNLPGIVTNLQNVLGSHIVNRNVLLSSSISNNRSSGYTWTTAHATLMSAGQLTRIFASNYNKYDDGEANYRLPIFNFAEFKTGSNFWLRGVWGHDGTTNDPYCSWYMSSSGSPTRALSNSTYGVRPLIYLR